jgi:hypothetical protein
LQFVLLNDCYVNVVGLLPALSRFGELTVTN